MTRSAGRPAFVVLTLACTFGLLTLWIPALWPWTVFQSVLLVTASAYLLVYAVRPATLNISPWLVLPLGPAAIGLAQLLSSATLDAWQTRRTVCEWVTYAAGAFLAFLVFQSSPRGVRALRLFVVAAAILSLVSVIQNYVAPGRVLWLFESGYEDAVFGPFVYHTKLANFAELAIPVAVWLACAERHRRSLYLVCAITLAGAVVASASRGGILILVLEALVLGAFAARSHSRRPVLAVALSAALLLVCGAAVFGWDLAAHRFTSLKLGDDLRWPLAATSLEMAHHYWLTGSGLGTWNLLYPEFARFDLHVFINQAHCDWLQWWIEGGLALPVLMALMIAVTLQAARREWWTLGLLFVWIHGLADYPMQQTPAFACLQIAFWGAALAVWRTSSVTFHEIVTVDL